MSDIDNIFYDNKVFGKTERFCEECNDATIHFLKATGEFTDEKDEYTDEVCSVCGETNRTL